MIFSSQPSMPASSARVAPCVPTRRSAAYTRPAMPLWALTADPPAPSDCARPRDRLRSPHATACPTTRAGFAAAPWCGPGWSPGSTRRARRPHPSAVRRAVLSFASRRADRLTWKKPGRHRCRPGEAVVIDGSEDRVARLRRDLGDRGRAQVGDLRRRAAFVQPPDALAHRAPVRAAVARREYAGRE